MRVEQGPEVPDRRQREVPQGEAGFTMILTLIATLVVSLLVGGALAAVNIDLRLTGNDLDHKRAYAAAKAGIADYAFHLNRDTHYWLRCTDVPTPNAVNQVGSTANRRPVPGDTGAEYAIELVPATGHSSCDERSRGSMLKVDREQHRHLPDPLDRL